LLHPGENTAIAIANPCNNRTWMKLSFW
jgi:hypothetical protein